MLSAGRSSSCHGLPQAFRIVPWAIPRGRSVSCAGRARYGGQETVHAVPGPQTAQTPGRAGQARSAITHRQQRGLALECRERQAQEFSPSYNEGIAIQSATLAACMGGAHAARWGPTLVKDEATRTHACVLVAWSRSRSFRHRWWRKLRSPLQLATTPPGRALGGAAPPHSWGVTSPPV